MSKELESGFIRTIRTSRLLHTVFFLYLLLAVAIAFAKGLLAGAFFAAGLLILPPILYVFLWSLTRGYKFLVDWVPDRSVGTLGIIIAGFGVLGEAYQFTTQLVV